MVIFHCYVSSPEGIWNGGWTSIHCELFWCFGLSTMCFWIHSAERNWQSLNRVLTRHHWEDDSPSRDGTDTHEKTSWNRWAYADEHPQHPPNPQANVLCSSMFFQCMGKQFDDLDLSSSHSNHHSNCYTIPLHPILTGYAFRGWRWPMVVQMRRSRDILGDVLGKHMETLWIDGWNWDIIYCGHKYHIGMYRLGHILYDMIGWIDYVMI